MNNNRLTPPNNVPQNGPVLVGQPFSFLNIVVPVNATLQCNCGGKEYAVVEIVASTPAVCGSCGKVYVVGLNPQNGQVFVQIGKPVDPSASPIIDAEFTKET